MPAIARRRQRIRSSSLTRSQSLLRGHVHQSDHELGLPGLTHLAWLWCLLLALEANRLAHHLLALSGAKLVGV